MALPLPRYNGVTVQTTTNAPAPSATVTVFIHNTNTPADLFSDEAGTVPLANPLTSDAITGLFAFYAANGIYDLTITGLTVTPYTIPAVQLVYQGAPIGQLLFATSVFQHSDILTLPTTELTILPAPGAGLALVPLYARAIVDTSNGAYTNIDPGSTPGTGNFLNFFCGGRDHFGYLTNGYATGATDLGEALVSAFFGVVGQQVWEALPYGAPRDPPDSVNQPFFLSGWGLLGDPTIMTAASALNTSLTLSMENGALGNLTGGGAGNTLTTVVAYLIL